MGQLDRILARHAIVGVDTSPGIHVPDALQIAAALEAGATLFVTNDRRLAKVREIDFLLFDDHIPVG